MDDASLQNVPEEYSCEFGDMPHIPVVTFPNIIESGLLFMHFLICKHKTTTTYMLASCLHS
jgi:hypothetical protein